MRYLYTLLLLMLGLSGSAQKVLTLSDCREMSLAHNKKNKISSLQIDKAKQDVATYQAKFFPHLSAQGNYLFSSGKYEQTIPGMKIPILSQTPPHIPNGGLLVTPAIPLSFSLNNSWLAGVMLTQPLYTGGKIRSAFKMAKLGKDMSLLNRRLTNADILYETDNAYWTVIKVQELVTVAHKYHDVVEHLLKDVQNAFDEGMVSRNEILKVQVKLNEAKLQSKRAENGVVVAKMHLCHLIGLPLTEEIQVTEKELEKADDVNIISDIQLRPEYQLLTKNLDLKYQEIRLARADYLPQVGVIGGWSYSDMLKFNGDKVMTGNSFSAMFSVKIPLFQWGEGISKVRSKKIEHQMAQLQRDDASEKMLLEMTMSLNAVEEAKLEVDMTKESLNQAAENLNVSKDQYDVGLETLTNHLEAQTLWQKSWAELVEAKAKLRLSEVNYLKSSGQLYVDEKK